MPYALQGALLHVSKAGACLLLLNLEGVICCVLEVCEGGKAVGAIHSSHHLDCDSLSRLHIIPAAFDQQALDSGLVSKQRAAHGVCGSESQRDLCAAC